MADGWAFHGAARLGTVTDSWNLLELPLRLVVTGDFALADIRVLIVRSIPPDSTDDADLARYRAGLTKLRVDPDGNVTQALVAVATASPLGKPYSVEEQVTTLLHELGHAVGLPHSDQPMAIMAARPVSMSLTRTDVRLARDTYARRACPPSAVARR